MNAPAYIQKELRLINPLYFAVYDGSPRVAGTADGGARLDRQGRWLIRKWKSFHPVNQKISGWRFNSKPILTICETDDQDRDIGYHPLDMRVIQAVRAGLYFALNAKKVLEEVDRNNDRIVEQEDAEFDYVMRYMAKSIYKHYNEPTVILG